MGDSDGRQRSRNTLLHDVIKAAGVTYETLARSVRSIAGEAGDGVRTNRSAIAHWVAGTMPSETTARYLAEALSRQLRRPVTLHEIGLAETAAGDAPVWCVDTLAALNELGRDDLDMGRRRALTAAAYSVAALTVPGPAWWTQMAEHSTMPSATKRPKVGCRDLETVRDMAAMFSRADQRHGGGHARTAVVQYLTTDVAAYLNGQFTHGRLRREMFSAAGELAYLSGWMAFDSAEHALAQRYFTTAVSLAAEADDAPMAGHVLRAMAHQAVDLGHPGHALNVAEASVDGARYVLATPRERALLGVVHARALAVAGRRKAAVAALLRAEDALSSARPGDEDPARVFFFGEASLAHETACTLRDIGDLNGAQQQFRRSVRTRAASSFTRTHAVTLGYLGGVQARQGAFEEACATWSRALDSMDGIRSARARRTAVDMRRALSPVRGRGIPTVTELDHRAASYLAESV